MFRSLKKTTIIATRFEISGSIHAHRILISNYYIVIFIRMNLDEYYSPVTANIIEFSLKQTSFLFFFKYLGPVYDDISSSVTRDFSSNIHEVPLFCIFSIFSCNISCGYENITEDSTDKRFS